MHSIGQTGTRLAALEPDWATGLYYYRARYYDQSAGRFLAEDPVGFDAGPNFYDYVLNNPIIFIDPTGLQVGTLPPDPRPNTIVCNGRGGIRIQLGNLKTLGDGSPKAIKCLEGCARVHEQSHIGDALAANRKVCKGQADGRIVAFDPALHRASEIKASDAEIDCLRSELDHGCKGCGPIVLERIGEVQSYGNSFKKSN
jgi:RHS repeat-associated protein